MEVLQISKYLHCSERLDFTGGLLATEEKCSVIDISPSTLAELLKSGNIENLESIVQSSYQEQ